MSIPTTERERREIEFWRDSPDESPESDSVRIVIDKMQDAGILLTCIQRHEEAFRRSERVLELGAGQGWASCLIKRQYPEAEVIATDISPYAVASVPKWERLFNTRIDGAYACRSYEIAEDDASLDCVFCFAAAHHFSAHRRTLQEIHRVLRPHGRCYYFYEPSCRRYLHTAAHRRVNRKRPDVPEDVLIFPKIRSLAAEAGLSCEFDFFPSTAKRGAVETLYFYTLGRLPILQQLLPCTINYCFIKQ